MHSGSLKKRHFCWDRQEVLRHLAAYAFMGKALENVLNNIDTTK